MDEEASLGTAWWKERRWKSEQAGSPCSGWAYWSCHILGEARAPAIQDTPAPQLLTHQVHPPPRPQTVLTGRTAAVAALYGWCGILGNEIFTGQ